MTTIQIELCKEDRARLDAIIKALESKTAVVGTTTQAEEKTQKQAKLESLGTPVVCEQLPFPVEPKKETAFQPSIDDIRDLIMRLSEGGKKAIARSVIEKYATNVSAIKTSDYLAVYTELKQALKDAVKVG